MQAPPGRDQRLKSFTSAVFAAAMATICSIQPIQAQDAQMLGIWRCEQGVAPLTNTNLPSVYVIFDIELYANGTMRAEGIANQVNQFRAQGQWNVQNGRFTTQGQMTDALGPSPFGFSSLVTSATTMNERSADQVNSYATACQKSQ